MTVLKRRPAAAGANFWKFVAVDPTVRQSRQHQPPAPALPQPNQFMTKTAEFVSPKHPDKMCDFIADSILDAYLAKDKNSRVAVEVMGGHGLITLNGEVTSRTQIKVEPIVKRIMGKNYRVVVNLFHQSPEIARGVDLGGAGDQGIMKGYATAETKNHMPLEYDLARELCRKIYKRYPFDGKTQVTIKNKKVIEVVASFQNTKNNQLEKLVRSLIKADVYHINPVGEWHIGGFDADAGITGRKLVVDAYGPEIPIGGGSFSGKDYTKVDRSGAYMARKIAVDYLKKYKAKKVFTKLAYAIGRPEALMAVAIVDSKEIPIAGYDLTPGGIKKFLKLDRPIYASTALWGHFGNGFSWDR